MAPQHWLISKNIPYLEEKIRPETKVFEVGEKDEFSLVSKDKVFKSITNFRNCSTSSTSLKTL